MSGEPSVFCVGAVQPHDVAFVVVQDNRLFSPGAIDVGLPERDHRRRCGSSLFLRDHIPILGTMSHLIFD